MFYKDGCGWCARAKPAFKQLCEELKTKSPYVSVEEVYGPGHEDLVSQYDVQGYPTFVLITGNGPVKYKGSRTVEDFESFIARECPAPQAPNPNLWMHDMGTRGL